MPSRRKIEVSSDSGAPQGEKTTLDGTEYFPISGSQVAKVSSVKTYIAPIDSDSTHYFDGTGSFQAVKDAHLSFSDITTNNATTAAHGFLPKLSGDSTSYLNGDGEWTSPGGGNAFGTIAVSGQSDIVADAAPDTLTIASGSGVTLTTNAGSDTLTIAASGSAFVLDVNTTPVGNVGTGEDNLISYSVPANTLDTNGQYIHFVMGGTFAASVNNKRIRVKFGATTIFDTGALAITAAGDWHIEGYITRTGSATEKCIVEFVSNETALTGSADYVDATEDLTTILTLKATGEATDNDDIIEKFHIVEKGGGVSPGGGGSSLSNSNISPTTSNVTASVNTRYFANISGLTANRNFVLPAGTVGDIIELNIKTGDDAFAFIVIGDTGITINGGSAATEWSRLFITNETIQLVADTTSNWQVVIDKRIPCLGKLTRTGSDANTTHSAAVDVTADWNTIEINKGDICDTTNDRFNIRRAGNYIATGSYAPAAAVSDQNYMITKIFNGATQVGAGGLRQSVSGSSSLTLSGAFDVPIVCAAGDTIIYMFETQAANIGLNRTDSADDQQGQTFFSIVEVL